MKPWTIRCPGCKREYQVPLLEIVRGRWPWRCAQCTGAQPRKST
jgi:hypothetical protein